MCKTIVTEQMKDESYLIHKDGFVDFTGNQSLGGNKLIDLDEGINPTDAVNISQLTGFSNHTIPSHSDTSATGGELNTLTNGVNSNADTLHKHDQYDLSNYSRSSTYGYQVFPSGNRMVWCRSSAFLQDIEPLIGAYKTYYIPFGVSFNTTNIVVTATLHTTEGAFEETENNCGVRSVNENGVNVDVMRICGNNSGEYMYVWITAVGY